MRNRILLLKFFLILFATSNSSVIFSQNNRLTNDNGQLLWQYTQTFTKSEENTKEIEVSFIFINGIEQTAISLRQELFYSQIEWVDTLNLKVDKEERVEYITVNLAPHQSIIFHYVVRKNRFSKELFLEKSAILIMNENFEIRKEIIPEQRFNKE
jgi:hypothetical protein